MLSQKDILNRLPHRPPILLVDEVVEWEADTRITAQRFLPADDRVFEGHFPGEPILPGVLTVEAMAQSAALLVNLTREKTAEEALFLFMQIENARFKHPVKPEDTLTMEVTQTNRRGDIYWFEGEAKVSGKTVASACFTAKFVDKA